MPGLPHVTDAGTGGPADPRPYVRWSLWLAAGMIAGLLAGFAVGLGRPRPRQSSPEAR
ncbi:MAG: hypothetical protein ACR2LI_07015 [Propionibacteriaceae bacterium]